jgi:signal transduction histidine kinase
LLKKIKDKNKVLKNISIKLKNNLSSISGFTQIILSDKHSEFTAKQKQYLINILTSADLLNNAINDISY